MSRDPMPPEFEELAVYNSRRGDGTYSAEYAERMADLQAQFDAWNEWQMRRDGFRPLTVPGCATIWVKGPQPDEMRKLAKLILEQETGLQDGSLIEVGGYVYPAPKIGAVEPCARSSTRSEPPTASP